VQCLLAERKDLPPEDTTHTRKGGDLDVSAVLKLGVVCLGVYDMVFLQR
jgi:hypothetical protein